MMLHTQDENRTCVAIWENFVLASFSPTWDAKLPVKKNSRRIIRTQYIRFGFVCSEHQFYFEQNKCNKKQQSFFWNTSAPGVMLHTNKHTHTHTHTHPFNGSNEIEKPRHNAYLWKQACVYKCTKTEHFNQTDFNMILLSITTTNWPRRMILSSVWWLHLALMDKETLRFRCPDVKSFCAEKNMIFLDPSILDRNSGIFGIVLRILLHNCCFSRYPTRCCHLPLWIKSLSRSTPRWGKEKKSCILNQSRTNLMQVYFLLKKKKTPQEHLMFLQFWERQVSDDELVANFLCASRLTVSLMYIAGSRRKWLKHIVTRQSKFGCVHMLSHGNGYYCKKCLYLAASIPGNLIPRPNRNLRNRKSCENGRAQSDFHWITKLWGEEPCSITKDDDDDLRTYSAQRRRK